MIKEHASHFTVRSVGIFLDLTMYSLGLDIQPHFSLKEEYYVLYLTVARKRVDAK